MPLTSTRKRTRYGTRTVYAGRCPVPSCGYRGPDHYKASLAQVDLDRHVAREHPRPKMSLAPKR